MVSLPKSRKLLSRYSLLIFEILSLARGDDEATVFNFINLARVLELFGPGDTNTLKKAHGQLPISGRNSVKAEGQEQTRFLTEKAPQKNLRKKNNLTQTPTHASISKSDSDRLKLQKAQFASTKTF